MCTNRDMFRHNLEHNVPLFVHRLYTDNDKGQDRVFFLTFGRACRGSDFAGELPHVVAGPCLELSPVEDAAALVRAVVGLAVLGVEVQPGVHHGAVQVAEHAHLLPDDGKNKKKIGHYG